MTILWSNNASTTVSGSITPASTSVQLSAGTGVMFPNPTSGNYYVATFYDQATKTQNEIVHVTAMAGDVATIVRAQEGTTAKNWGPGDIFANLVTAGTLAAFVQAGTGPANTAQVFVGTDTSTTVNLVIANTNPVPSSLAVGMLFNILINNTNTAAVNVQLNGGSSIPLVRMDNAAMLSGDITKSMETTFVYNGVNFNTMIPDLPRHPSQTIFYVNPAGNDNNTGFANTPQDAFATVYGAINAIKARYTSQLTITIRVADGTYIGGFQDNTSYIAAWSIIGNVSNPNNCIIDASSTTIPPGAQPSGVAANAGGGPMEVAGFTLKSYQSNANSGSSMYLHDCNFTANHIGWDGPITSYDGYMMLGGNNTYSGQGRTCQGIIVCRGGHIDIGSPSSFGPIYFTMNCVDTPTVSAGTACAANGGVIAFEYPYAQFTGYTPQGPKFNVAECGGVLGTANIPGSQPGAIQQPAYYT